MIVTIIVLVVVLSLLVFAHEFGHFITAKLAGAKVEEFGFGFPPRLAGFKRGGTIYSINWIPLGGFVRIKGESGDDTRDPDSFANKSLLARSIVICAGVAMNLLLAWFVLSLGYVIGLPQVVEDLPPQARVAEQKLQVYSVLKDSPAFAADLKTGDVIAAVDGRILTGYEEFRQYTAAREGTPIALTIGRDGEALQKSVTPRVMPESGRAGVGIAVVETGLVSYPWYLAPVQGAAATWFFLREIVGAFAGLLRDLFTVQPVSVEFSGPVGIAIITAEVVRMGFRHLLQFTALLSVNLAVINILPFPALDGGRLLFLAIERLRRRAVSARIEALVHSAGFVFLMMLVLVITYQDMVKFGDRILSSLGRLFGV